jgi:hypothetical protein
MLALLGLFVFFRELGLGLTVAALDILFIMAFVLLLGFYHVLQSIRGDINSLSDVEWQAQRTVLVATGNFQIGIRILLVFVFVTQALVIAALDLLFL